MPDADREAELAELARFGAELTPEERRLYLAHPGLSLLEVRRLATHLEYERAAIAMHRAIDKAAGDG